MHFINIFPILIPFVLLTPGQCKPTRNVKKTSMKPVTVVPTSFTPGNLNICEDFVHVLEANDFDKSDDGVDIRDNDKDSYTGNRNIIKVEGPKEVIRDLMNENYTRQLKKQFRKFTKRHVACKAMKANLKKQRVENYFEVDHTTSRNMTSLMQIYTEATKISLLLSLVRSDGAKECCLDDKYLTSLYRQFRNKITANLYPIVLKEMADWTVSDCVMEATTLISEPMRCEDVAHVTAVVLKDLSAKSKALWKKMRVVEKNLLDRDN